MNKYDSDWFASQLILSSSDLCEITLKGVALKRGSEKVTQTTIVPTRNKWIKICFLKNLVDNFTKFNTF